MSLNLCIAQLNFVVGDMAGNARRIIEAARGAHAAGAQLLLTPELAVCGYAAEDLFFRPAFLRACDVAVQTIARELASLPGLTVVVGHPMAADAVSQSRGAAPPRLYNAASVIRGGRVIETYAKRELPNDQVFDERRYFTPGQGSCVFEAGGISIGLLICQDAWCEEPAHLAKASGAELLVVINASPFHVGKGGEREQRMRQRVAACGLPLVYAHLVGGQDELVFEGGSFALGADGRLAARAASFEETLFQIGVRRAASTIELIADVAPERDSQAQLWDALVLGTRDYLGKNGFRDALLGLSGGIDSALVLAIAVDALGKDHVRAVMMPSVYTAAISLEDAREMARRLDLRYDEISIVPEFERFKTSLAPLLEGRAEDATEENIQARIRGLMLMALSNKFGHLLLTTGNKSEYATGYCTLYGDMCGGFAPIKDVTKTAVFGLARWRNAHDPYGSGANPIPERIITRAPSAELRPDQKDQDSLPPYEVLDAIIERAMENDEDVEAIVAAGFAHADVQKVMRLMRLSEHKRRQAAQGVRVTRRSFGKDWRYPLTNRFGG